MTHVPPGHGRVLYAVPVTGRDLNGEAGEAIAGTMHLLQRRIRPDCAVRLTAVDGLRCAGAERVLEIGAETGYNAALLCCPTTRWQASTSIPA